MRVPSVLIVMLAVAVLVIGCGSSAHSQHQTTSTSIFRLGTNRESARQFKALLRELKELGGCAVLSHDPKTGKLTAKPCKHR